MKGWPKQCPQPVKLQEISLRTPWYACWLIFCLDGKPLVLLAIYKFSITYDVHFTKCHCWRDIIFQHGNAQPHTVSLMLGTNVKYRYGVLPCPPYSPDLAPLRLWPVQDLGKLDEGLALWEWCGYPGVMHTFLRNAELDMNNSIALKSTDHHKKCKDCNGIFEKKWQNMNRTSSYWGQYLLSGKQICFRTL